MYLHNFAFLARTQLDFGMWKFDAYYYANQLLVKSLPREMGCHPAKEFFSLKIYHPHANTGTRVGSTTIFTYDERKVHNVNFPVVAILGRRSSSQPGIFSRFSRDLNPRLQDSGAYPHFRLPPEQGPAVRSGFAVSKLSVLFIAPWGNDILCCYNSLSSQGAEWVSNHGGVAGEEKYMIPKIRANNTVCVKVLEYVRKPLTCSDLNTKKQIYTSTRTSAHLWKRHYILKLSTDSPFLLWGPSPVDCWASWCPCLCFPSSPCSYRIVAAGIDSRFRRLCLRSTDQMRKKFTRSRRLC